MTAIKKMRVIFMAVIAAMLIGAAALAQDDAPKPMQKGDVTYITGGYGLEEREAIEATKKDYNLLITNATAKGLLTADIAVTITGKGGQETLMVEDAGPLLYVKLPDGGYIVKALGDGKEQTRKISVSGGKKSTINFIWADGVTASSGASSAAPSPKFAPAPSTTELDKGSHILGTLTIEKGMEPVKPDAMPMEQ